MNIAVVEDNQDLRFELEFLLTHHGHSVSSFSDAGNFWRFLDNKPPLDMLVLDLGLPDEDGLSVAEKLKGMPGLGVVMLTARGALSDRIEGFERGADVYLTKPVNVSELNAVMESIRRRISAERELNVPPDSFEKSTVLKQSGRQLILPNGQAVGLTAAEGTVLKVLVREGLQPVSRRTLSEALGQDYINYDERRLEAIVSRLRKKLKAEYSEVEFIKAARGVGYQLTVLVRAE
ncbi:response regulator transcription factor [Parendozoicomonas sp. Alg238-R29]|uniref:response regulator transcription factor n=1 Tax=Parendozoicomonas sp. Alg238-R29 TaxID=2993446 RepID=UPI00248E1918|nr:response regulator transcription factor [Parendozoicomonas sp. Alg238-R29]